MRENIEAILCINGIMYIKHFAREALLTPKNQLFWVLQILPG